MCCSDHANTLIIYNQCTLCLAEEHAMLALLAKHTRLVTYHRCGGLQAGSAPATATVGMRTVSAEVSEGVGSILEALEVCRPAPGQLGTELVCELAGR